MSHCSTCLSSVHPLELLHLFSSFLDAFVKCKLTLEEADSSSLHFTKRYFGTSRLQHNTPQITVCRSGDQHATSCQRALGKMEAWCGFTPQARKAYKSENSNDQILLGKHVIVVYYLADR